MMSNLIYGITIDDTIPTELNTWLKTKGYSAANFLIQVAIAILIYFIIYKVTTRLLKSLSRFLEAKGLNTSAHHFLIGMIKYTVLITTAATIIVSLNIVEASSIAALIASAGVGISLAAQGTLSNFAGGLLLLLLKPFSEGDYIRINELNLEGTVEKITIYYTTIRTLYNDIVEVPNSSMTGHAVTNSAGDRKKRLQVNVGISYDADVEQAIGILEEIMVKEPRILPENCKVVVEELGESAVILAIRAMVQAGDYHDVRWDLNRLIKKRFDEEQIEITYNHLNVHIKEDDLLKKE